MMHPFRRARVVVALSFFTLTLLGATAAAQSAPQPIRPQTRPARDTVTRPLTPTTPPSAGGRTVVPPAPFPSHVDIPAVPRVSRQMAPRVAQQQVSAASQRAMLEVPRPSNATARCKDGTYVTSAASQNQCDQNGGLGVRFPVAQSVSQSGVRP
jgi:hypothetical protein